MGKEALPNGVDLHCDHNEPWYPSINVKAHGGRVPFPDRDMFVERLGVCEACAQRIVEYAWEAQADYFWINAEWIAAEVLGLDVDVLRKGRSGGWLSVSGLGEGREVMCWDEDTLSKWYEFERRIWQEIRALCEVEAILDMVTQRDWHTGCHLVIERHMAGRGGEL